MLSEYQTVLDQKCKKYYDSPGRMRYHKYRIPFDVSGIES